ncbi:hypothetical protein BDV93DRAFT_517701 [Ceratobasidium sp. AG-I]|nr:hypothetical protein BDV93DRAFT_517701 [Ceratobasidium sp. AG-I]
MANALHPIQPKSGTRLPFELHRVILERIPTNRSGRKALELSTITLVCREWRNWAHTTTFKNLDIATDVAALRTLTLLCATSSKGAQHLDSAESKYRTLGSFIQYISITIGQPTGYGTISLSDLVVLLSYTPDLEDLALTIIQPNQVAIDLGKLDAKRLHVPSLTSLRIKTDTDATRVLSPLVACCLALQHLSLEVYAERPTDDNNEVALSSGIISFRSLGCWEPSDTILGRFVLHPSNTSLRAIELHRCPSPKFLTQLARVHGQRIESLTLRSMEPTATRTWSNIIDQFTALHHLSVWCLPSADFLKSVQTSNLRHFEFRRPFTHSNRDHDQVLEVVAFLKSCPVLGAMTYHAAKQITVVDQLAEERGIALNWRENHYIDGYMEDPRDFLAVPYSTWQSQAFPSPPPRMTRPRTLPPDMTGYDTSGWDLPIHSAKSDLFL